MSLPLKAAAAAGVLTGGSLAGCYFGGVFSDTPWLSIKEDHETANSYTGKVGASYSIYLLAVHGARQGETEKNLNEAKWKELYKRWNQDKDNKNRGFTFSDEFADGQIDKPYVSSGVTDSKALNKVCETLYSKTEGASTDNVDFSNPSGTDNRYRLARDLLRYCSPLEKKPTTIKDDEGYSSGSWGADKKSTLASTLDKKNYYFWQAQEKWFLSEAGPKNDLFFKKFFEDGNNGSKTLNTSLKDICHQAYGFTGESSSSTADKPKKDDVEKYCSFKKITA